MRLRNATARDLTDRIASNPCYLEPDGPLDWPALFANANPVELEVGCGKGMFLLAAARERPGVNFFGVEIARKYAQFVADRASQLGLTNVRVVRADAQRVLCEWVADCSISALHVYFPDPWWKRRHLKRRLFSERFVTHAARVLRPGGVLRLATDVQDYFRSMQETVANHLEFAPIVDSETLAHANDVEFMTHFERKYRKVGKPIWRANYRRLENRPTPCVPAPDFARC